MKIEFHIKQILAFVLVVVVAIFGMIVYTNNLVERTTNQIRLHQQQIDTNYQKILQLARVQEEAALSACHRLNILRASDNLSHFADYRFFTLTIAALKISLAHPPPGQIRTPQVIRQTQSYIKLLQRSADDKTWIALTPCNTATVTPTKLVVPTAHRFKDQIPPQSIYHLVRGE